MFFFSRSFIMLMLSFVLVHLFWKKADLTVYSFYLFPAFVHFFSGNFPMIGIIDCNISSSTTYPINLNDHLDGMKHLNYPIYNYDYFSTLLKYRLCEKVYLSTLFSLLTRMFYWQDGSMKWGSGTAVQPGDIWSMEVDLRSSVSSQRTLHYFVRGQQQIHYNKGIPTPIQFAVCFHPVTSLF